MSGSQSTDRRRAVAARRVRRWTAALLGAAALLAATATTAAGEGIHHLDPSQYGLSSFTTATTDMTAGARPDVTTEMSWKTALVGEKPYPFGRTARIEVDLPPGLVGNPTAFPTCTMRQFYDVLAGSCPPATQVGETEVVLEGASVVGVRPIFNLVRGPDQPIILGVVLAPSIYGIIHVEVAPDGKITAVSDDIPIAYPLMYNRITLWGVPADHTSVGPRVPFVSGSTECQTVPTTTVRAFPYEGPLSTAQHSLAGPLTDCESLRFEPVMRVTPSNRAAGAPTGLDVELTVPQNHLPDGRATAHVRDVEVVLPEGMRVSPSSANGLGACSPAQFGYRDPEPATCPDASKIGQVTVESPLLEAPMHGSVFLAKQNDNPFNSLLALYIEVEGAGQRIKLAGRVDPDPVTGRLTTDFSDNPQLPFERLTLSLKTGPRAPLVNPPTCGEYQAETRFRAWSESVVVAATPMVVDRDCHAIGFAPSFEAGTMSPVAGRSSDFVLRLGREAHDRELRDVSLAMPNGLLAKLAGVQRCAAGPADAGACGEASRIGSVVAASGAGPLPYRLPGQVYLTEGYKGGDYGLSVVVPAVAGPFDLGLVVVRAAIHVDRRSAQVRVVSDPLPRILKGIPTQIRSVEVSIDRPGFMLNPTSCAVSQVDGEIAAQNGHVADVESRFQASECAALPFGPRLGLRLVGRRQRSTGGHPGVRAVVRQSGVGEAGIRRARVVLPPSLALDPDNAQALCEFEDGTRPDLENHCPAGSKVGRARARTPLLDRDLVGDVFFVKNVRRDRRTGNLIRTLPMIVVALRGEIAINLVGKSSTTRNGRLVNTFAGVPDAPISRFNLNIKGGRNGILAVTGSRRGNINLCAKPRSHRAVNRMVGQNGKRADYRVTVKTPCGKARKAKAGNRKAAAGKRQAAKRRAAKRRG